MALLSPHAARAAADGTWVRLGPEGLNVRSIAADPANPVTIWAAGNVGIPLQSGADTGRLFRSTDAGANWARVDFGVSTTFVDVVAVDPRASAVYLGVSGFGLRRSGDGGRTWQDVTPERNGYVQAIAIDPNDTATVYAGLYGYGCEQPCLYKSLNRGDRWTSLVVSVANPDVLAVAIHPTRSQTVFVATSLGLFRTDDGGTTWSAIDPGPPGIGSLAIDPGDPGTVYAGGAEGAFRSDDGGASWRTIPVKLDGNGSVWCFAIDRRTSPAAVYAGGPRGVSRTFDRGAHWEALSAGIVEGVASLAISTADPPVLYAGTGGGVYALTLEAAPPPVPTFTGWIVPSSAHAPGANGAFYKTDLAIANPGAVDATFAIRFLGHDGDGTGGPLATRTLAAGRAVTYADVLGSLFGIESGYGALRIVSDSTGLRLTAFTSTPSPDGRGRVGQAVPAFDATRLASPGSPAVLVGLREDASARTNLVLASVSEFPVTVELTLSGADGAVLGRATRELAALGMTQVSSVVSALGGSAAGDAYLVVRVATAGGAVAAYASVTDNETNDPRTILP